MSDHTIAAISTPLGEGGIGVIRISGADAIAVADRCFEPFSKNKLSELAGYQAAYGRVTDGNETVDDAVALVFRAPHSYTGEDVVEISVHAGRVLMKKALRIVLKCGAEAAAGGEFTKRAFLNGKLDLAKAESVMELISSKNETALRISRAARDGRISRSVDDITASLLETAASLAVFADYPDEDIPSLSKERFSQLLSDCNSKLSRLLSTYDAGRVIREGIDCAIVGKPNVGKSTLMNLLCGCERSIVTEIAGTTRDVIENTVALGDVTLILADTAGIHETCDKVEQVGVDRARSRMADASLILAVFDTSKALDGDDLKLIDELKGKRVLIVFNKSDLEPKLDRSPFSEFECVELSALSGEGLEPLTEAVAKLTDTSMLDPDDTVLISERQRSCAQRALDAVCEAQTALLCGITLDAVGVCVDDALHALLELTGKRVTNEVTDEVFRKFCVGK